MPASSSTWMTPTWAKPRAAPPPSASPTRGSAFGNAAEGPAEDGVAGAVVQAGRQSASRHTINPDTHRADHSPHGALSRIILICPIIPNLFAIQGTPVMSLKKAALAASVLLLAAGAVSAQDQVL